MCRTEVKTISTYQNILKFKITAVVDITNLQVFLTGTGCLFVVEAPHSFMQPAQYKINNSRIYFKLVANVIQTTTF